MFPFHLNKAVLRFGPGRWQSNIESHGTRFSPAVIILGEEEVEVDVLDIGPSVGGGEESVEGGVLGEIQVTGGGVYPWIVEGVFYGSQ